MPIAEQFVDNLRKLMDDLDPKSLQRAVRNILNREARLVKRHVQQAFREDPKGIAHAQDVANTVRVTPKRGEVAFFVRVGNRGKKFMHKNRRGLLKPVAFWLNNGVEGRKTKSNFARRKNAQGVLGQRKLRQGRNTGSRDGGGYIEKGEKAAMPIVYDHIDEWFEKTITDQAVKRGLL